MKPGTLSALVMKDIDLDGVPDVVLSNQDDGSVSILVSNSHRQPQLRHRR